MTVYPIAKINLGLNVVERRPDGYHNLETVFYPIPIADKMKVRVSDDEAPYDCTIEVSNISIEGDPQQNLVVRAYELLKHDFPTLPKVDVRLQKNIPTQAGMGGGSSDCAYMILLLNNMFDLGLTTTQMEQYAARLGADCAFFIQSRPCYAEGIGEKMTPISLDLNEWYIGVVRPNIPVPTRDAFARIHPHHPKRCCRDVVMQPVDTWRDTLVNDFEESVFALHPTLADIKAQLYDMGATYAAMSGSGSALFGLFMEAPTGFAEAFDDYTYLSPMSDDVRTRLNVSGVICR